MQIVGTPNDQEIWRSVAGYEGRYEVSSWGRVRRLAGRGWARHAPRILSHKPPPKGGYGRATLFRDDDGRRTVGVHILVAEAFLGPKPSLEHEVAHGDGNLENNRVSNLRWATAKENGEDRVRHGTSPKGERHGLARFTEADIRQMKMLRREGVRVAEIAIRFGVARGYMHRILTGQMWGHVTLEAA